MPYIVWWLHRVNLFHQPLRWSVAQVMARVWRFGQTKVTHIYRLLVRRPPCCCSWAFVGGWLWHLALPTFGHFCERSFNGAERVALRNCSHGTCCHCVGNGNNRRAHLPAPDRQERVGSDRGRLTGAALCSWCQSGGGGSGQRSQRRALHWSPDRVLPCQLRASPPR
jgi:hypothetical protein